MGLSHAEAQRRRESEFTGGFMSAEVLHDLYALLWDNYTQRVSYARVYQQMILSAGGTVANDHIAFRSLGLSVDTPQGEVNLGIEYLGQVATALGYEVSAEYHFPHTHLYARYYRHPQQAKLNLPKLFISELLVDELPADIAQVIYDTVALIPEKLPSPASILLSGEENYQVVAAQLQQIFTRPWLPPRRSVVEQVNQVSQYGAWVLLHGYSVNHFTGYVNSQNTPLYADIDTTSMGLAALGVPMKAEIEGNVSTGLRQTATQAVTEMVTVLDDNQQEIMIPWTYAYYEIAQRYMVEIAPGRQELYDAFLGNNAQELFKMTQR